MGNLERFNSVERPGSRIDVIRRLYEQGPCGGVLRILRIADIALEEIAGREPLYTNHDLVHNVPLMEEYRKRGLIVFNNNWDLVPKNPLILPSAHGVGPSFWEMVAKKGGTPLEDSTCQLVKKVELQAKASVARGFHILYVGSLLSDGKTLHPEPLGISEHLTSEKIDIIVKPSDLEDLEFYEIQPLVVLTQTTLSRAETNGLVEVIKSKWPWVQVKDDICYATDNRQAAVIDVLRPEKGVDLLLVVGSEHSHNSKELLKIGLNAGVESHLFDDPSNLQEDWLMGKKVPAVTSGASVLPHFVDQTIVKILDFAPTARVVNEPPVSDENLAMVFKFEEDQIRQKIRERYAL